MQMMGDYATSEQGMEQILAQLMQQYQPPRRPAARAAIEKLPRLEVPPLPDSGDEEGSEDEEGALEEGDEACSESDGGLSADEEASRASNGEPPAKRRAGGDGLSPEAPNRHQPPMQQHETDQEEVMNQKKKRGRRGRRFACVSPGEACTICHDCFVSREKVLQLPCEHCFHEDCITPWLKEVSPLGTCMDRQKKPQSPTPELTSPLPASRSTTPAPSAASS